MVLSRSCPSSSYMSAFLSVPTLLCCRATWSDCKRTPVVLRLLFTGFSVCSDLFVFLYICTWLSHLVLFISVLFCLDLELQYGFRDDVWDQHCGVCGKFSVIFTLWNTIDLWQYNIFSLIYMSTLHCHTIVMCSTLIPHYLKEIPFSSSTNITSHIWRHVMSHVIVF